MITEKYSVYAEREMCSFDIYNDSQMYEFDITTDDIPLIQPEVQ